MFLSEALVLANGDVQNEVLVGPSSRTRRVLVCWPTDDAVVVDVRISGGRKARPITADCAEERPVVRVEDVIRRRTEVVAEDEVSRVRE